MAQNVQGHGHGQTQTQTQVQEKPQLLMWADGYSVAYGGEESEKVEYGEALEVTLEGRRFLALVEEGEEGKGEVSTPLEFWLYEVTPVEGVEPMEGAEGAGEDELGVSEEVETEDDEDDDSDVEEADSGDAEDDGDGDGERD